VPSKSTEPIFRLKVNIIEHNIFYSVSFGETSKYSTDFFYIIV